MFAPPSPTRTRPTRSHTGRQPVAGPGFALVAAVAALCALPSCVGERGPRRLAYMDDPLTRRDSLTDDVLPIPFQLDVQLGAREVRQRAAWEPVDDPYEIGFNVRTPVPGSRFLNFDFGGRYAFDKAERGATTFETQLYQLDGGMLLSFAEPGSLVQPYVGLGMALLFFDNEIRGDSIDTVRDRNAVLGRYLRGGLAVEFRPAQLIGLEIRYTDGDDTTYNGLEIPVEAVSVSLTFGARF